jgi:dethiobiotin synthetase
MQDKPLFVTGIGTGIGKTLISAILVEKLKADYWKPVQAGELENSDTLKVKSLISNPTSVFHAEAYKLSQPFSPHIKQLH